MSLEQCWSPKAGSTRMQANGRPQEEVEERRTTWGVVEGAGRKTGTMRELGEA